MKYVSLIILTVLGVYPVFADDILFRPKAADIDPAKSNVKAKLFIFSTDTAKSYDSNVDSILQNVTHYFDVVSLNRHHMEIGLGRRSAPDQDMTFLGDNPESYYIADIPRYDSRMGILQEELFRKAYNEDSTAFKDVEFIFLGLTEYLFRGYTGMGKLGGYHAAGLPTTLYNKAGISFVWLDSDPPIKKEGAFVHEYCHQLGLPHVPQNEAYRYYGWYAVMNNRYADHPSSPPLELPWLLFYDLWTVTGEYNQITQNLIGAEIAPFLETHKMYYYVDADYNAFVVGNYPGNNIDSMWNAKGLMVWHTQSYNVWDIEAAHGNWENGLVGGVPKPNGFPAGSDSLDMSIDEYHSGPTDFFDGVNYTAFTSGTNPNTNLYPADTSTVNPYTSLYYDTVRTRSQDIPSRFAILNIRKKSDTGPDANTMLADFYINNWSGSINENTTWNSDVHVSGDITVAAGVTLTIRAGLTVSFEPNFDDRENGSYTGDAEIIINGTVATQGTRNNPVVFTSSATSPQSGDWGGITVKAGGVFSGTQYDYLYAERAITYE